MRKLAVLASVLFILSSCKKTDIVPQSPTPSTTDQFFSLVAGVASPVRRVAQTIEKQNLVQPFIETFLKKEGLPV